MRSRRPFSPNAGFSITKNQVNPLGSGGENPEADFATSLSALCIVNGYKGPGLVTWRHVVGVTHDHREFSFAASA
jgi:hypothetical protein